MNSKAIFFILLFPLIIICSCDSDSDDTTMEEEETEDVCMTTQNVIEFFVDGTRYELINENQSWEDAAACAVQRGGFLAEINSEMEQDGIFDELSGAAIVIENTVAFGGGNGSYVWLGGNDITTEGTWIWDGNNDRAGTQFWMGDTSGSPVGGLFNNWGEEPDNFSNQDGLAFALTNWPRGTAGQWNDINTDNTLFFLVEYRP